MGKSAEADGAERLRGAAGEMGSEPSRGHQGFFLEGDRALNLIVVMVAQL